MDPDLGDTGLFLQYDSGWLRIGIVVSCVVLGLFFRNLYAEVRIRSRLDLFQNLCLVFGVALIGQGLISYINHDLVVPRKVMLLGSVLAVAILFATRLVFNSAAQKAVAATRLLFIGMSPTAATLAKYFDEYPETGATAVGYLEAGKTTPEETRIPRLGGVEDIERVLDESGATSMIIVRREDIRPRWVGEFLTLRFGGIKVEEASSLYERTFLRKCATEILPSRLIFGGALEPSRTSLTIQPLYSFAFASVAFLAASPIMLAAALLVRLSSAGPVLEKEPRIGLDDVPFPRYRFRCRTKTGALTPVGKMLNRLGVDTLPGLFNVMRGQMAIVGPRAEHPLYSDRLSAEIPYYRQRNRVKPGLTGWAAVHGAESAQDTICQLEYDLYYVENLSPALDSLILLLALKNRWRAGHRYSVATLSPHDAVE
jgi:lipopolysaccharide/colanic/teichoic acid biosynthesis glycosyltransferase